MKIQDFSKLAQMIDRLSRWYYFWRFEWHLRLLLRRIDQKS